MTQLLWLVLLPFLYWTAGPESAPTVKAAGVDRVCVPAQEVERWQGVGVTVTPLTTEALGARQTLLTPGIEARAGLASPTRAPWVQHNGWRFRRETGTTYVYEAAEGRGALAVAEAAMYGVDAVVTVAPADLPEAGQVLAFLSQVPVLDLPDIADFGVVDDGTAVTGEVLNLLVRRNLLFSVVSQRDRRFPMTIRLGTKEYPRVKAADPSSFALAIRRQLTDERRSLRVYGSEVVIARLTGDAGRRRLHLLNYGGRAIDGLRVRVRGQWRTGEAYVSGTGKAALAEHVVLDAATECSLPPMRHYAIVDLRQ